MYRRHTNLGGVYSLLVSFSGALIVARITSRIFRNLQNQEEEHYKQITIRLEGILGGIDDTKSIAAKETTLLKIQDSLVARDKVLEDDLDRKFLDRNYN